MDLHGGSPLDIRRESSSSPKARGCRGYISLLKSYSDGNPTHGDAPAEVHLNLSIKRGLQVGVPLSLRESHSDPGVS
jgi:hypothetical protein